MVHRSGLRMAGAKHCWGTNRAKSASCIPSNAAGGLTPSTTHHQHTMPHWLLQAGRVGRDCTQASGCRGLALKQTAACHLLQPRATFQHHTQQGKVRYTAQPPASCVTKPRSVVCHSAAPTSVATASRRSPHCAYVGTKQGTGWHQTGGRLLPHPPTHAAAPQHSTHTTQHKTHNTVPTTPTKPQQYPQLPQTRSVRHRCSRRPSRPPKCCS